MKPLVKLVVVLMVALVGAAPQAGAGKPAKASMRLAWKPGAQHASCYFPEKGYFAQKGIELNIIPGATSAGAVKQRSSRAIDVAFTVYNPSLPT